MGKMTPTIIQKNLTLYGNRDRNECVHAFVHTLDEMSRSWYVSTKLRREITMWEELTCFFANTFSFKDSNPDVHNALHIIHDKVLKIVRVAYPVDPHVHCHNQSMMEFYNMYGGPEDDDELQNINIPETKGSRNFATLDILTDPMNQLLKIRKSNIGTEQNPKFASVGDYWGEETMEKNTDLLHEF